MSRSSGGAGRRLDPDPGEPAAPDLLPGVPAETPADFRPVAVASRSLLATTLDGGRGSLRTAYLAFVGAIQAAAPDARLAELGEQLSAEFDRQGL